MYSVHDTDQKLDTSLSQLAVRLLDLGHALANEEATFRAVQQPTRRILGKPIHTVARPSPLDDQNLSSLSRNTLTLVLRPGNRRRHYGSQSAPPAVATMKRVSIHALPLIAAS